LRRKTAIWSKMQKSPLSSLVLLKIISYLQRTDIFFTIR
jgi:hypothetical protein